MTIFFYILPPSPGQAGPKGVAYLVANEMANVRVFDGVHRVEHSVPFLKANTSPKNIFI